MHYQSILMHQHTPRIQNVVLVHVSCWQKMVCILSLDSIFICANEQLPPLRYDASYFTFGVNPTHLLHRDFVEDDNGLHEADLDYVF